MTPALLSAVMRELETARPLFDEYETEHLAQSIVATITPLIEADIAAVVNALDDLCEAVWAQNSNNLIVTNRASHADKVLARLRALE